MLLLYFCASSSVVERCPDKTEVEGPIPSLRTYFICAFSLVVADKMYLDIFYPLTLQN